MDKLHYLHSRAGRIGGRADTTPADVDAIVEQLRRDERGHLVIHFHGGLVSKESGLQIAKTLSPVYSPSPDTGGYPLFFIWESGAWETIRNNITELADEPVFKQLLRKLVQYALEKLGGTNALGGGRSVTQASVGNYESEVKRAFEEFWSNPDASRIPFRKAEPISAQARSAPDLSENEVVADLERDVDLQRALATLPDILPGTRSGFAFGSVPVEHRSEFAELASREFSKESGTRGLVEIYTVARYLLKVLRGVLKRYRVHRDHGLYATCVEELIRSFKIAGSGVNEWGKALQWNRMKQDTVDAFGPDPDVHVGTALLSRLQKALANGILLHRLTLVGHSTGAIYIANWLESSQRFLPQTLKQDVIFLAPAITYQRFAHVLRTCAASIGKFRMFAMKDAFEREDQVWGPDEEIRKDWRRFIYPSSLLYLVSGILESREENGEWIDEADMPLVGMERFFSDEAVYSASSFAALAEVRTWLSAVPNRLVWSKTTGDEAGLVSDSTDHGAFDNDARTLESLTQIVS